MAGVLNPIIAAGGTTAIESPVSPDDMAEVIETAICCHVAIDCDGAVAGMQWLDRSNQPGDPTGYISTFARLAPRLPGVGRLLFSATCRAARAAGLAQLNAKIRADNRPGLGYYGKMGFKDHEVLKGVPLSDGTPVDRVIKLLVL